MGLFKKLKSAIGNKNQKKNNDRMNRAAATPASNDNSYLYYSSAANSYDSYNGSCGDSSSSSSDSSSGSSGCD